MIKEKPILFNTEMVRAVLAGNKTETRRVIKSPAKSMQESGSKVIQRNPDNDSWYKDRIWSMRMKGGMWGDFTHERFLEFCPYGIVGDRLWVRETFQKCSEDRLIAYKADGIKLADDIKWKPSIHMFRKDSRINLEITDIRVERVQDIKEEGAKAEGIKEDYVEALCRNVYLCSAAPAWGVDTAREAFKYLWNSINEKRDDGVYSWDKSPWVWVVEFKLIEGV